MNTRERNVRKELDETKSKIEEKLRQIEKLKMKQGQLLKELDFVESISKKTIIFNCYNFTDPTSVFLSRLKDTDEVSLDVALFLLGIDYKLFKNKTTRGKVTTKYTRYSEPDNVQYRMTVATLKSLIKPVNANMKLCLMSLLNFCYKYGLNLDRFTPIGELDVPGVDMYFSDLKDLTVSDLIIKGLGREGFFKSWEDLDTISTNTIFGAMRIPYQVSCLAPGKRGTFGRPEDNVGYYHKITKCDFLSKQIPVYIGG